MKRPEIGHLTDAQMPVVIVVTYEERHGNRQDPSSEAPDEPFIGHRSRISVERGVMLRRLAQLSFATRILAVAAIACTALAVSLFLVVKQTVEADAMQQAREAVAHAGNFHRYL